MELKENLLTKPNAQTILVGIVTLALVTYLFRSRRFKNLPPGPLALPFIGNMHNILANREGGVHKYFTKLGKVYGDVYSIYFGKRFVVILNSLDVMREAIIDQADLFNDRTGSNPAQKGENAIRLRKMTVIAFRDFGVGRKPLDEQCRIEVSYLLDEVLKANGKPLDMKSVLLNTVSNIICSVVFGKRFEYDDTDFKFLLATLNGIFTQSSRFMNIKQNIPIISKILYGNVRPFDNKYIQEFIKRNAEEHRATFDPNEIRDYMDLFIKLQRDNPGNVVFSEASMYATIFQLFAAGTDTTSTTLRWMLAYLIHNPDVQEKCYAEVKKEIGSGRLASYSTDKDNCNYLWATIHETQRISTIVPMGIPHCVSADTTLRGYNIPAQTEIKMNLYNVHMNPKAWPEPEKFKPDRWLNKDGKFEKKTDFIPFSLGRRMCLGDQLAKMELFIFSSNLIKTFKFEACDPNVLPNLEGIYGITFSPQDYQLRAIPRE